MIWNWLWRHPGLVDGALLGFLLLVTAVVATHHTNTGATLALGAAQIVPLAWRRRRPLAVLVAVTAVALVIVALGLWLAAVPAVRGAVHRCGRLRRAARPRDRDRSGHGDPRPCRLRRIGDGRLVPQIVLMAAAWLLGESVGSAAPM